MKLLPDGRIGKSGYYEPGMINFILGRKLECGARPWWEKLYTKVSEQSRYRGRQIIGKVWYVSAYDADDEAWEDHVGPLTWRRAMKVATVSEIQHPGAEIYIGT